MGYDCTFHLIDETAIREEFVPKLLGRSKARTPLDRGMEKPEEMWATARRALAKGKSAEATSAICQFAVIYSSCSLPHHYERGFALSFWDTLVPKGTPDFPNEFCFSPEVLFAEVVKKHPKLKGRFSTVFTGNFSTGVFVPAAKVPEVLGWLEQIIGQFNRAEQRAFKGLLGIMRAAAQYGFAFWQATDLAIPTVGQFPGNPNLMTADYLHNLQGTPGAAVETFDLPTGCHEYVGGDDRMIVVSSDDFKTAAIDLSRWPPLAFVRPGEMTVWAACGAAGRWLLCSETDLKACPRIFRPRVFADLRKKPAAELVVLVKEKPTTTWSGGFIDGQVVVFPENANWSSPNLAPLWQDGKELKPLPGLPATASQTRDHGIARLAAGAELVIFGGQGYELRRGKFRCTFPEAIWNNHSKWTSVPAGKSGFFYLSKRRLFEVHRGKKPIRHMPRCTNIMHVRPGPVGSLLLQEGGNDDADVAKLYFPAEEAFVHIQPEMFDDKEYDFIGWFPTIDRFVVSDRRHLLALPTSAVVQLPRCNAKNGRPMA